MSPDEHTPDKRLATPVQYLPGVGPHRVEMLQRLGLDAARDLLFFFPRTYEDLTHERAIAELEEGALQSVRGVVDEVEMQSTTPGRCVLGMLVRTGDGYLRAIWFNQPFMAEKFQRGQKVIVVGKPRRAGTFWEMPHPRVMTLSEEEEEPERGLLPVYPLTEGLRQWEMRRIIRRTLDDFTELLDEAFPPEYREAHALWPLCRALRAMHFPRTHEEYQQARRRLVYQELLVLQLALALKRHQQQSAGQSPRMEASPRIDARIRRLFPFALTAGQEQAIGEIASDMAGAVPMNRLLQGDVGSGKTIVAVYALLLAVAHGYQAALMAPTEVLARQHAQTLGRLLVQSQVRRAELIGGQSASQRDAILVGIAAGEIDLVVGTQAILQDTVHFRKLGLVVIDEQHKFGVRQRAALKQAGTAPHYLVMTATPIPRTITMTLFGDLDVSTLRDSPPGRQKIHSYLADESKRERWWTFFANKLREGRQGYVIAPVVDENAERAAASLAEAYESLANGPLEAFRLGLIHGRLSGEEKDAAMDRFRRGETQVLVATSVVEVGVDVPNATLMTIEAAERFGLAQLHQLRGRISRGQYPGYCCLFAEPQSEESQRRLDAFVHSTDGFKLAEIDFELRGPGDLLGTRQHGLPPFRVADLLRDTAELAEARRDARELIAADPGLSRPEYALLRRQMLVRYGKALDLGDVG